MTFPEFHVLLIEDSASDTRMLRELLAEAKTARFRVGCATRLAAGMVARVKALNPRAHLCFYGLYAPVNAPYLRRLGAQSILGGEFETGLVQLCERLRRQELPTAYTLNGVVYVARSDWFLRSGVLIDANTIGYPMPKERSVDIDTAMDLRIAELLLSEQRLLSEQAAV